MKARQELAKIFCEIDDPREMEQLFQELFTPKEREDLFLRWELLKDLYHGKTHRAIAADHGISLCKITRGSKILKEKSSISNKILNKYYGDKFK